MSGEKESSGKKHRKSRVKEQVAKGRFKPVKKAGKNRKGEKKAVAFERRTKFYTSDKGRQGLVVRMPRYRKIARHMRENIGESFSKLVGDDNYKKPSRLVFSREYDQTVVAGIDAGINQLVQYAYMFADARHGGKGKTGIKLTLKDLDNAEKCIMQLGRQ